MSDVAKEAHGLVSLASITQGAGLFFLGMIADQAFGFITNLVLTRTLGTQAYGLFTYLDTIFSLITILTLLGSRNALLRFLPEYRDNSNVQNAIMTLAYGTSLLTSIAAAVLIYVFAPIVADLTLSDPRFVEVLRVGVFALPFLTLADITYSGFKSIEEMEYNVTVSSVAMPLARLMFVGGAAWLGYSVIGSTVGLAVAALIVFLIGIVVLATRTQLGEIMTPTLSQTRDYYAFSVPLTFHHIGTFLYSRVDLLMVGFFLTGSSVGIYRIAALLAGFLAVPLTGFNQLFPPIASRLYRNGEREELEQVYSAVTRWIFTLSLLPGCIALVYTNEILLVFGEGFTMGSVVMILFVIGQLINSVAGPSAYLLMMTDHEYLTTLNQVTFGLLNVVLNYVLITNFGFIGAAIATATVLAAINILMIFEIWYLEGLLPYDRTYIWVLLAGAVSFASMTLLSDWIDGFFSLVIGGSTGTILFVVVIRYTAVTDDDKQLIDSLITNIV